MSIRRFDGEEPTERHDHYDADGTHTGWTVITREPEWDERARMEAVAAVYADWRRCPNCGTSGLSETATLRSEPRNWNWHDGRVLETYPVRCLGCAALATAQRRWDKRYENHKPTLGTYAPYDGVRWQVDVIQGEAVT